MSHQEGDAAEAGGAGDPLGRFRGLRMIVGLRTPPRSLEAGDQAVRTNTPNPQVVTASGLVHA